MTDQSPEDPYGWEIRLTKDGKWQPVSLDDESLALPPEPTKQGAVDAAMAHRPL